MSFRKSFSGFRKKVKDKLLCIGDKTTEGQANPGGGGFDHPTLSLQSEPGVIVGGEFRGRNIKVSIGEDDPQPGDLPSASQSVVGVRYGQGASGDKTPHVEEPGSTWITSFQSPCLTDDVGNSVVHGPAPAPAPAPGNATVSRNKSDWKHTASSAAKLFLRTVDSVSDAFPPLKSTAAGLCFILDNCEVWSTIIRSTPNTYGLRSKQ